MPSHLMTLPSETNRYIKKETLCDMIIQEKIVDEISNLNGIDVYLDVKRV